MPTYFHRWRRKLGVLTLAMACVLIVGWVRSGTKVDSAMYPIRPKMLGVSSVAGSIHLHWIHGIVERKLTPHFESSGYENPYVEPWEGWNLIWSSQFFGLQAGSATLPRDRQLVMEFLKIPYWSIVIPLTLLSAWLLLSKPRLAVPS